MAMRRTSRRSSLRPGPSTAGGIPSRRRATCPPWIGSVRGRAVPHREDANRLPALDQLIDDPIRAHAERPQPAEQPAKPVGCLRLALEEAERLVYRVRQMPLEGKDLPTGPPCKDNLRQLRARPPPLQLAAELGEGDRPAPLDLTEAFVDRRECLGVRQDLRCLLERLVLVDWDEHGGRTAAAGHHDVLAQV